MNILILNWRDIKNPKSGGAEVVTQEHAKAWVRAGHNVYWFTSYFSGAKKRENIEGVEIIRWGNAFTVYLAAPFRYLFSGLKFDLVIDEIHGIPFFTPLFCRKPKIVLIHEVAGPIWDYMLPKPLNLIGRLAESFYFKLYRKIRFWVPSNSTKEDLLRMGIQKENITPIYCAINNSVILRIPKKEIIPTFIFVSRVVKMKGIEEVIKSFFFILSKIKKGQLWIVGDGDEKYKKALVKTIHDYSIANKVKFFGRVSEAKKLSLMRRAHILLHASVKEGWGLVVVEAASQATPSVVYDVGGLRDSVINGKTGIVIQGNSPKEMAYEAVGLIEDRKRYSQFQNNGLNWAKQLNWETITKESLELIENVVKNK